MLHSEWKRDTDSPCLSLGLPGSFDDMHISSPCVIRKDGKYFMYYTGSRGAVNDRVFRLGLAVSEDGVTFRRYSSDPVFSAEGNDASVLTPSIVNEPDGTLLRAANKIRLYYSVQNLSSASSIGYLCFIESSNGITWEPSVETGFSGVYSPGIIFENSVYRMWFTDVTCSPWAIGYAESRDGVRWKKHTDPLLTVEQKWEHKRLNYPYVLKLDGIYYMWYGSQLFPEGGPMRTAIGTAKSFDGISWEKLESNPVFEPDPNRKWESTYVSDQCVLLLSDGCLRMWYASRTHPPTEHKYFTIGTAVSVPQ